MFPLGFTNPGWHVLKFWLNVYGHQMKYKLVKYKRVLMQVCDSEYVWIIMCLYLRLIIHHQFLSDQHEHKLDSNFCMFLAPGERDVNGNMILSG